MRRCVERGGTEAGDGHGPGGRRGPAGHGGPSSAGARCPASGTSGNSDPGQRHAEYGAATAPPRHPHDHRRPSREARIRRDHEAVGTRRGWRARRRRLSGDGQRHRAEREFTHRLSHPLSERDQPANGIDPELSRRSDDRQPGPGARWLRRHDQHLQLQRLDRRANRRRGLGRDRRCRGQWPDHDGDTSAPPRHPYHHRGPQGTARERPVLDSAGRGPRGDPGDRSSRRCTPTSRPFR